VLVDPTGRLVAILDFDTALLIPAHLEARRWFDAAYREGRARPAFWDERVRLVALVEALNTLPNAITIRPARRSLIQTTLARIA
jgi:hypothetical protein